LRLDYTGKDFVLTLDPRVDGLAPADLMLERGLDYSLPDSRPGHSVLYTREPWAVADMVEHATPRAAAVLKPMASRIAASRAETSDSHFRMPPDKELWPFQRASLDYVLSRQQSIIADAPGLGKEQRVDEPVLTPSGWRPIGELEVGDKVFAADGTVTEVIGVFPQGMKASYRVTFRDGTSACCGEEHLWKVYNKSWKGEKWRVISLRAMLDNGFTMPRGNRKNPRFRIPLCAPVQFPERDLPVDPYVLGVLLGDGSLTGPSVNFSNPDFDSAIREEILRRLPGEYALTANRHAACPSYEIVRPNSRQPNPIKAALEELGVRVLSGDKFLPDIYFQASVAQRLDLLRGLMDTDGSCTANRTTFHTISPLLANGVADLVRSLGGQAVVRFYDRAHHQKPGEFQVNVKMEVCPFFLPRKAAEWAPQRGLTKAIWGAEYEGSFESVCIRIAHPEQLYITRDYTVTHNTPQAIVYANEIGAKRVLVICPAAIRHQWARRIREWSTMRWPFVVYTVSNSKNGIHPTAEWTVISYALARNPALVAAIAAQRFDLLIVDESHYLKDPNAGQTKAIYGGADGLYHFRSGADALPSIISRCAHVLCLSGTPIVNRPLEAYTTSRNLCWDSIDYMSLEKFRMRYNPQKTKFVGDGKRVNDERIGRVRELGNRMRGTFMARHAKRDVMKQLHMPEYEIVQVEETGEVRAALRAESLLGLDIETLQTTRDYTILGHIAQVRREMGIAVAPQAADYVRVILEGGEDKVVVFGWHIEVLDILQQSLARFGVLRIDGSTTAKKRQHYIDLFRSDPAMRVMLGNIQSMGTGVDGLQEVATHCVLVEPSWTPGENQQAVDRLDRGGQKGQVQADFLVAPGSVAEKILVAALRKADTIHRTIG
jgi:hypothetical protein